MEGSLRTHGNLKVKVNRCPKAPLSWKLKNILRREFIQGWIAYHVAPILGKAIGFAVITSNLSLMTWSFADEDDRVQWIELNRRYEGLDENSKEAKVIEREMKLLEAKRKPLSYGVVSYRLVTTAFVTALATALHTQASPGNLFYHALGTNGGGSPAAVGDTGMATELTTEYTGDVRATGTHTSAAGVYESVATNTIDSGTPAVDEHGVMGAASGASTLIDRHVFADVNMVSGDSLVSTYALTFTAGG